MNMRSKYGENEVQVESPIDDTPIDSSNKNISCRICYENKNTMKDPLIAPCNCLGTVKYIHVNCLKSWLKERVIPYPAHNGFGYRCDSFVCELCRSKYPSNDIIITSIF